MALNLISLAWGVRDGLRLHATELEALQLQRLRRLLDHSYENVPYYRKLFDSVGFRPGHLKQISDLSAIPITTRQKLQTTPSTELIARGAHLARLERSQTSGSTGAPLHIYRAPREKWFRLLLTLRAFLHNGMRLTDRVVTISSRPPSGGAECDIWVRRLLRRRWNISFFEEVDVQLRKLLNLRPAVVYGYAANVAVLADLLLKKGLAPMPLRIAASSGEILMPGYRRVIQKAFCVDPVDMYSAADLGHIAWQCNRRKGFHINADWLHVEIVRQEQSAIPGEFGEVVVTSLYRYAMPLIRYSPGDFASLGEALCPCGLGLPLLNSLEGRTQSLVPLPNGRYFIGFSTLMSQFSEVSRYQVVQKALDHFVVNVIPGAGFFSEVLSRVSADLSAKLGAGIRVEARAVTASELIQGPGKFRPVIPIGSVDFSQSV